MKMHVSSGSPPWLDSDVWVMVDDVFVPVLAVRRSPAYATPEMRNAGAVAGLEFKLHGRLVNLGEAAFPVFSDGAALSLQENAADVLLHTVEGRALLEDAIAIVKREKPHLWQNAKTG